MRGDDWRRKTLHIDLKKAHVFPKGTHDVNEELATEAAVETEDYCVPAALPSSMKICATMLL